MSAQQSRVGGKGETNSTIFSVENSEDPSFARELKCFREERGCQKLQLIGKYVATSGVSKNSDGRSVQSPRGLVRDTKRLGTLAPRFAPF
jgi:hypothetical protein